MCVCRSAGVYASVYIYKFVGAASPLNNKCEASVGIEYSRRLPMLAAHETSLPARFMLDKVMLISVTARPLTMHSSLSTDHSFASLFVPFPSIHDTPTNASVALDIHSAISVSKIPWRTGDRVSQ